MQLLRRAAQRRACLGRDTPDLQPVAPCLPPAEGTAFVLGESLAAVCLIPKACVSTGLRLRRGDGHVEEEEEAIL